MTITNKIHGPANSSRPSAAVSLEQAKQITLGHAGIATDEVSFIRTLRDYYKDGSIVYKVEFIRRSFTGEREAGFYPCPPDGRQQGGGGKDSYPGRKRRVALHLQRAQI